MPCVSNGYTKQVTSYSQRHCSCTPSYMHMHHLYPSSLLWPSYKFTSHLSLDVVCFVEPGIVIKNTIFMYNDIDLRARQHIFLLNCGIFGLSSQWPPSSLLGVWERFRYTGKEKASTPYDCMILFNKRGSLEEAETWGGGWSENP